jgi:acetoacetyl-CoA synthetase
MERMDEPLWSPNEARIDRARITELTDWLRREGRADVADFEELHHWSVDKAADFWRSMWDFFAVVGDPGERLIHAPDAFPGARFLPDARLNLAENLLHRAEADPDGAAVIEWDEDGARIEVTWSALREQAGAMAGALQAAGVGSGDRVVAWLPNGLEAVVTMLGATWIGATYSSTSPDFGVDGVLDRFGQIEPTVLVAADGYRYGGTTHDCLARLGPIVDGLPSLERVVVASRVGDRSALPPGVVSWDDFLGGATEEPPFERFPIDHPWYVLYSSGTTGKPKCIVHRSGGLLLKHLVEHQLHGDLRTGDRVFYYTTTGWMMWNWLVSGLAAGETIVLYDGSPFHRDGNILFDLAERTRVALFGISAKFLEAVGNAGLRPVDTHDLSQLRTICSTGSPLSPEGFELVYNRIHPDVHLASISGGTDLCGCLVAGDPTAPVWPGEIQRPGLGMDIDVVDVQGAAMASGKGDLVCRSPFPSMPLGFWDDPGDDRYHRAYFNDLPGLWRQGDYAEWTEHGGIIIHGRSDATLNPGGVRIGTAEIYRQVEQVAGVVDSLVIGQRRGDDTRVVLFVVTGAETDLDDDLQGAIRDRIRRNATPRHVPAVIAEVDDIPRTRSGKIVELAVRATVHNEPVLNREALANPEALDQFADHPALR